MADDVPQPSLPSWPIDGAGPGAPAPGSPRTSAGRVRRRGLVVAVLVAVLLVAGVAWTVARGSGDDGPVAGQIQVHLTIPRRHGSLTALVPG